MINFFLNFNIYQQVTIAVLLVSFIIQAAYYFIVYLRPARWKMKESNNSTPPASIIICAKNEESILRKNLPAICKQKYNNFEVIVVNDCSEDDTELLLGELAQEYKNLRHTTIEPDRKFSHGKKLAVTIGIKSAKNDRLVFTDADCYPTSENWLSEIMKSYTDKTEIVLGYGGYETKKGFLNKIIRFDTVSIAMQYLGHAIGGKTYMGIGRNMSYLKSLFYSGKGFQSHIYLQSGDDDLFVNEHATKNNVSVILSKNSFTLSEPMLIFRDWTKQKRRHLTTAKYYKIGDKIRLGTESLSRMTFYISLVISFLIIPEILICIIPFGIRLIFQLIIYKVNMNKLNEKGFLFLVPILDILMPITFLYLIFVNKITRKNNKWR